LNATHIFLKGVPVQKLWKRVMSVAIFSVEKSNFFNLLCYPIYSIVSC